MPAASKRSATIRAVVRNSAKRAVKSSSAPAPVANNRAMPETTKTTTGMPNDNVDEEIKVDTPMEVFVTRIMDAFNCGTCGKGYCYVSLPPDSYPGTHLQMDFSFIGHLAKYVMTHPKVDLKRQPVQLPPALVNLLEKKNSGAFRTTGKGQESNHMMPQTQNFNHMSTRGVNSNSTVSSISRPTAMNDYLWQAQLHFPLDSYPSISTFLSTLQEQERGAHNYVQYEQPLLEMGGNTIGLALLRIRQEVQMKPQTFGKTFISLLAENATTHYSPPPILTASGFCHSLDLAALEYERHQDL